MTDKTAPFKDLIGCVSEEYQSRIATGLENVPESFWVDPPSLSGKYHPSFDHGYSGTVRHVVMALRVALDLVRAEFMGKQYSQRDIDVIVIAVLFHDAVKRNDEGHSAHEHPLDSAIFCNKYVTGGTEIEGDVFCAIRSHMGKWTASEKSEVVLPKPETTIEHLVHMADYIASRKYVMFYPDGEL